MNKNFIRAVDIYKLVCIAITAIYFGLYWDFPFADKLLLKVLSFGGICFFILHLDITQAHDQYIRFKSRRRRK
jgi:hypothetical protein